jgi:hypothetical protein
MAFRDTTEIPDEHTLPGATSSQPCTPLSELDRKPSDDTSPISIPRVKDLRQSISEHAVSPPSHQLLEVNSNKWSATPESRQEGVYSYKVGSGRELISYPVEQFPDNFSAENPFTSIFSSDELSTNVFKFMSSINDVQLNLQILNN